MKLGINVRIDVKKIDKSRLYQGNKCTYLDMTTFIDTEKVDQYGDNGFISQSVSKEEREKGIQGGILGNCKLFFKEEASKPAVQSASPAPSQDQGFEDDIPF